MMYQQTFTGFAKTGRFVCVKSAALNMPFKLLEKRLKGKGGNCFDRCRKGLQQPEQKSGFLEYGKNVCGENHSPPVLKLEQLEVQRAQLEHKIGTIKLVK